MLGRKKLYIEKQKLFDVELPPSDFQKGKERRKLFMTVLGYEPEGA